MAAYTPSQAEQDRTFHPETHCLGHRPDNTDGTFD